MPKAKLIKASLAFNRLPAGDVLARANAVFDGVYNAKDAFPIPPIDPATLKAQIDALSVGITASFDGGKKAIAEREHQKEVVLRSLRQLGHYVEENCKDDMPTFLKSGFQPVSTTRTPATPLTEKIRKIAPGKNSGEMLVNHRERSGRAQLSIAPGAGRSGRNSSKLDRAAGRPHKTACPGNRVYPRHGLRFSDSCRDQRRLYRLE